MRTALLHAAVITALGLGLSGCVVGAVAGAATTVAATAVGATARVGGAVVGGTVDAVTTSGDERELRRYREAERRCRRERRDDCGYDRR